VAAGERRVSAAPPLAVDRLTVTVPGPAGPAEAVRGLSFSVGRGEALGLVGESGAGKSLTALALLGLLPAGVTASGRVLVGGEDLLALPERRRRRFRGGRVAMVFQEPAAALNPVFPIGFQVAEAVRAHRRLSRAAARGEALALLEQVALPDARRRFRDFPHRLSGGQRQRVVLAMALAGRPEVLIADEPTTALDVTVQAQILDLLGALRAEYGLAVVLITHDLAVVAETCDRVAVMYAGRLVEEAPAERLFAAPGHPYTRALLAAVPRLGRPAPRGGLPTIPGALPEPGAAPSGCPFHPRCAEALARCRRDLPALYPIAATAGGATAGAAGHVARCFLHGEEPEEAAAGGAEAA
jgi:peptide/nickel transport system ATP-binding protein